MSLATSIKDFSDTLNTLHTVKTSLPIFTFLQEIFFFSTKTIFSGVVYLLRFEWFRDISYFPLFNPISEQQIEIRNAEQLLFPDLSLPHFVNSSLAHSSSHLFSFSTLPKSSPNYIVSGVVNSFFFSLPFSLPHLISIRRLFSQGVKPALASLIGTVAAHSLFLVSILYGFRFLVIPWLSLEPITYILGFFINVLVIKELIKGSPHRFQESRYAGASVNTNTSVQMQGGLTSTSFGSFFQGRRRFLPSLPLLRISLLSFGLAWCEELNVFSSITNLTFNAQNSYLDLYPTTSGSHSFFVTTIYVVAFLVGNCFFSILFYYLFLKSVPGIVSLTNLSSTRVNATINRVLMLLILTFTFASFPYYGLDYLVGKVGGFLPEDPIYKESVLSPTTIKVNKKNTLFIKAQSADKRKQSSLLDLNNFDHGVYLNNIDLNKFDNFPEDSKSSIRRNTSFEKSNYRQENAWIRRNYLARLRTRPRRNTEKKNTASFYKAFKDPKAYYQKMQLESDKKQSKSMRDLRSKRQDRYLVDRPEGILADEPFSQTEQLWDQIVGFPRDKSLQFFKQRYSSQKSKPLSEKSRAVESNSSLSEYSDTLMTDITDLTRGRNASSTPFSESAQKENLLDIETNIFAEKYTKGVKQKTPDSLRPKKRSLSTKSIIKRKFFLNPVYRSLLHTDIDAFMARQPVTHKIAENQEYDLYKKRLVLERYYNWLRSYSPLQNDLQDVYKISEPKSFVDSAFHHQFKGTFKIAKRLFPVTFDEQQNKRNNRVLSYDQTLYKDEKGSENPFLHEELFSGFKQSCQNIREKACSPFIEESDTSPFYAGWDETLRRFVITNKFSIEREEQ